MNLVRICIVSGLLALAPSARPEAVEGEIVLLSGSGRGDTVPWNFMCSKGRQAGTWTNIAVPSNWELQGFGGFNYGHDKNKSDETGHYRHRFQIPATWEGRHLRIVFEGVMTDTDVKINGQSAGPVHQGGFYRFHHDIGPLLKYGAENLLEVTVKKVSDDPTVEDAERIADFWVFGGIYRPVYLDVRPASFIDRIATDAKADGSILTRVFLGPSNAADTVAVRVTGTNGFAAGPFAAKVAPGAATVDVRGVAAGAAPWSAEAPNLYTLAVELRRGTEVLHRIEERIGFRTIEVVSGKELRVNGRKVVLKGANRHCFWPDSGRTLNRDDSYNDARLMKAMNMNAVRCSHYPPDTHFLEACDELGLYVIDELCTWQKQALGTEVARKLVAELIARDVNHPSVLLWANGNEGGWNTAVDGDYARHDPQARHVIHPWENFGGFHTAHYRTFEGMDEPLKSGSVYLPTEFLHGLYDGGHGAGLEEYWAKMMGSGACAGGFLWVLADEGIRRGDQANRIDVDGLHAPDGIVGPYREKEASFHTIQDVWSPVQIPLRELPADFDGTLPVRNEYDFRSLATCTFRWSLVNWPAPGAGTAAVVAASGRLSGPDVAPHQTGTLRLALPDARTTADALRLEAFNAENESLWTWCWPLRTAPQSPTPTAGPPVRATEHDGLLTVAAAGRQFHFDLKTGQLRDVAVNGKTMPFGAGPYLVVSQADASPRPLVAAKIRAVTASAFETPNGPGNVLDGKLETRWSQQGAGAWLQLELEREQDIDAATLAWQHGERRKAKFEVLTSTDGSNWLSVFQGSSSGGSARPELVRLKPARARFVRVVGNGNSENNWTSLAECRVGRLDRNAPAELPPRSVRHRAENGTYIVEASGGTGPDATWTVRPDGRLSLDSVYRLEGPANYHGIGFDFPEHDMKAMTFLGAGPYRVWQNRMRGTTLGVHTLPYNDNTPGETWLYPEFQGCFADLHWVRHDTAHGAITVTAETPGLFLRNFTPKGGHKNLDVLARDCGIGFLHAIPAIGNKFHPANTTGPQGQPAVAQGTYRSRLTFAFE